MSADFQPQFESELDRLLSFLGGHERDALADLANLHASLPELPAAELRRTVTRHVRILGPLIEAIEASPVHDGSSLGRRERSAESLIEHLCQGDEHPLELSMPTGAIVGRTLIMARINFLKALVYAIEDVPSPGAVELCTSAQELIDEGIFSRLADELLTGAASNPRNSYATRRSAARHLLNLWSNCVHRPVIAFPTVLLSAWRARRRVREIYGSLFGISELVALIREECEQDFVSFFTRDQVTSDQAEAFREFLFALPYEELQKLQLHMREQGVPVLSRQQVIQLTQETLPRPVSDKPSAAEVYASYRRRRIRAEYRALTGSPGPHKTAEGYIMQFLLEEEEERLRRSTG